MNLVLSWNNLVSPSTVIESFAGYNRFKYQKDLKLEGNGI